MSRKNSKRGFKKRKERERRNRKNRVAISNKRQIKELEKRVRDSAPLPRIDVDLSAAEDPDIGRLVEEGVKGLAKNYIRRFPENALSVLAEQHQHGWTKFVNMVAAEEQTMTRESVDHGFRYMVVGEMGSGILVEAPKNLVRRVLPTSSFTLEPDDRRWIARCRSLRSVKLSQGTFFQSPHSPTIRMGGKRRPIVFSRHALLQMADRLLPPWRKTYIGQLYIFGFFYECVHFGKAKLSNGQEALIVYNSCLRTGSPMQDFMRDLMGFKDNKELLDHYYIVGYCPLTSNDGYAVAKTFLTPGYWQTPERKTIKKSGRIEDIRDIEQACDEGINVVSVSTSDRTKKAIEWFHENGVPQVKRIEKEVFRDMDGPYAWAIQSLEDEAREDDYVDF